MLVEFQKYIEKHQLCNKDEKILVAVSGGVDSVVLLDLFVKSDYKIAVAHSNFQLRGKESDQDQKFVENLGKKQGLKVFSKKFETKKYATDKKLSIQVAARDLRYAWFNELIQEKGFDYVSVAQHINDQAETFFINLLRGSGLSGLRGMPVKRDKVIRPLMFAKRFQIEEYAKIHDLSFREDSSNKEDTYLRNKIRLRLLPELEKLSNNALDTIIESTHYLNEAEVLLGQLVDGKFDAVFKVKNGCFTALKDEIDKLQPLKVWMYYLLRRFEFNRDVTNNISETILKAQTGKSFYSATHEALLNRDELMIRQLQMNNYKDYYINSDQESITEPITLRINTIHKGASFKIETDPHTAQLDKDKLHDPLKLRKWKQGDRFTPLGMKGSKLLSDFFIDNKISNFEKKDLWLLISNDEIVWVVGYRISDNFKVTPQTKSVLKIKIA